MRRPTWLSIIFLSNLRKLNFFYNNVHTVQHPRATQIGGVTIYVNGVRSKHFHNYFQGQNQNVQVNKKTIMASISIPIIFFVYSNLRQSDYWLSWKPKFTSFEIRTCDLVDILSRNFSTRRRESRCKLDSSGVLLPHANIVFIGAYIWESLNYFLFLCCRFYFFVFIFFHTSCLI